MTGFETYPTRYALAQLSKMFLDVHSDPEKQKASLEEIVYPRQPKEEMTEEEHNNQLFGQLMTMVKTK